MTVRPAAATVFNDMLEDAASLVVRGSTVGAFELKKFEHLIGQLGSADRSGAIEMRAHVAAARDQFDEVDALYSRAIAATEDYVGAIVRYILVLSKTGQALKLGDVADRYMESIKLVPSAYQAVGEALTCAGWIVRGRQIEAASGAPEARESPGVDVPMDGFEERDIAAAVGFSHQFLRKRGAKAVGIRTSGIAHDDGPAQVLVELQVDQPVSVVSDLEWDLLAALGEAAFPIEQHGPLVLSLSTAGSGISGYAD